MRQPVFYFFKGSRCVRVVSPVDIYFHCAVFVLEKNHSKLL